MKRRRLAVIDFPMDEVHLYGVGAGRQQRSDGRAVSAGLDVDFKLVRNLQEGFRAKMEELLTQGRRFGVLDRKRQDVYDAERKTPPIRRCLRAGAGATGQGAGADYMLYGTVHRVLVQDQSRSIQLTGERIDEVYGTTDIRFTVLAVPTRQVKWSSSITVEKTSAGGAFRPEDFAHALLDDAAARIVDELTENIYPPKVTKVLGQGQFVVNRGGSTVEPGDVFEVFALGDWLKDPDTGERLDRLEMSVGIARIMSVKPKYSLAQLISETAQLSNGMVLRRRRVDEGGMDMTAPAGEDVTSKLRGRRRRRPARLLEQETLIGRVAKCCGASRVAPKQTGDTDEQAQSRVEVSTADDRGFRRIRHHGDGRAGSCRSCGARVGRHRRVA